MHNKNRFLGKLLLATGLSLTALLTIHWSAKPPAAFKNGFWRSVLQRPDGKQIVFNFEVKDNAGKQVIYVINGDERMLVDNIERKEDSVIFQMPFFESSFRTKIKATGNLEGVWIKKNGDREQLMPFSAVHNLKERFLASAAPAANVSGRWSVFFKARNRVSEAVGEFHQKNNYLTGTFLTPTGDYRYLEGVVNGDSLVLSGFDGGHAFLFTAHVDNNNKISGGKFYSGPQSTEDWTAEKNDKAALPDGFGATKLKPEAGPLNFRFTDLNGRKVSIADPAYKNKVVIIQLLGSWCPNCMDETRFMGEYYKKNRARGIEVIGIAYERTENYEESRKALQPFKKRFDVQYPVLIPGVTVSDPQRAEKTLPQLDKILAFPTTIFVDKKGNIRKVHSGFDGPATGEHHTIFKQEFEGLVNDLLKEK